MGPADRARDSDSTHDQRPEPEQDRGGRRSSTLPPTAPRDTRHRSEDWPLRPSNDEPVTEQNNRRAARLRPEDARTQETMSFFNLDSAPSATTSWPLATASAGLPQFCDRSASSGTHDAPRIADTQQAHRLRRDGLPFPGPHTASINLPERPVSRCSSRRSSEIGPDEAPARPMEQDRGRSKLEPFNTLRRPRPPSEVGPLENRPPLSRDISQMNPFDEDFTRALSEDNPVGTLVPSDSKIARPAKARLIQSASTSFAVPYFRNPFGPDHTDDREFLGRSSVPPLRRPSTFQRVMSMVDNPNPNPIPKLYRSKSVCSVGFYLGSAEKTSSSLPIFADDIELEKKNIQEYLAGVELLQARRKRKPWESQAFQVLYFFFLLLVVYFVFIGQPLWPGAGLLYYRWIKVAGIGNLGCLVFMGWAALQAFLPLLGARFEQEVDSVESRDASEVALIVPAYKAALVLPETIKAALKIFKPEQIYVIANGNSETPLDNAADVCKEFGVNHAWVPVGSKIVAEFVGIALVRQYKYVMFIDDDVHLPPNLPIVTSRLTGNIKCIGYTIKSTGADGIRGTMMQQVQDVEYKLSGLTRTFSGKYGSATFPHGAIILWDRKVLQNLFNVHPGYTISEDWYFGHAARSMGFRICFCSQIFVETETPPALFHAKSAARGGFGEMTVFKQRFSRWNYFYTLRLWEDTVYMLFSWRLGWLEPITKIFVLVEIYDSILAFLRPPVLTITLIGAWKLFLQFSAITTVMYVIAFVVFNGYHLRRKGEMVTWKTMPAYFGTKFVLLWVNSMSVYYGLYHYSKFFSVRHPRVIESRQALEAAYKVRLGTNLVPLDTHIGDETS